MKHTITSILYAAILGTATAQNTAEEAPISMNQLMSELRIHGGNFSFSFASLVYARITCEISSFPDGKSTETEVFVSDIPSKQIDLFFMDSPFEVGHHPNPNEHALYEMKFKLSNCRATEGTRIVSYFHKFSMQPWVAQRSSNSWYRPAIAKKPELLKEYVLNAYFREGDPYEAVATICFANDTDDFDYVKPYSFDSPRQWKSTSDEE